MNLWPPPLFCCKPFLIVLVLLAPLFSLGEVQGVTTSMRIRNECGQTVWPGLLTGSGGAPSGGGSSGGISLKPGQSTTIELPRDWSGRLWGRTGCNFSSNGVGACETGDCGGKLDCTGVGATPPATLAEFTIQGTRSTKDFYDVSLVDGFNLPLSVAPTGTFTKTNQSTCDVAGCASNLNRVCPSNLQMLVNEEVVGCKSACLALKEDMYCCAGAFANSNTCKPTSYSKLFKSACPKAYTYAFDDPSSLFSCSSTAYTITFCPSSRLSSNAKRSKGHGKVLQCLVTTFLLSMIALSSC